ncbi:MAG: acyl-CoA desaturase [Acidobacteria bacterium]|nr:acyl-CoA desaturase [Acidobacteriota bacterium]
MGKFEGGKRLEAKGSARHFCPLPFALRRFPLETASGAERNLVNKIRFPVHIGFYDTVKKRVNQYFKEQRRPKTGDWRMFLKTSVILAWLAISYVLLIFFSASLVVSIITAFALAQGFVLVGFNMMHDGAHGSYSKSRSINWLMGFTLDLIGGSHLLWRQKHNLLHHTYTNIIELDNDLQTSGLLRLSPNQKRYPWHRFQHLSAFPLYSLLTLSWVTFNDFVRLFSGRIGDYQLRQPTTSDVLLFFLTKIFYFVYMVVLPSFFHPVLYVLFAFVGIHLIVGFTLAIVFQSAHIVEGNRFPQPDAQTGRIENEWALHEVETTANFAPKDKLAAWYLGGLNFQIEHHLFPRICHIHYPAISKIVEQTCREFAISYTCYPTVWSAVAAHYRFLKVMAAASPHAT